MSTILASSAILLGRTVGVAPHSLFAVNVEHARAGSGSTTPAPTKNQGDSGPSIASLIAACPSLDPARNPTYKPTPWLTTGHLQTIWCAVGSFDQIDPVTYKRRVFLTPDGGTVSIDISPPELADADPNAEATPTVVACHGLTGGSHESYIRNCLSQLVKPKSEGGPGYRGVVVNFRGCADTSVSSAQLYSASKTSDLRSALLLLTKLFPSSPMVGIGFSLGANVLGKYLGEEGDESPLLAGVIVGTPFDLKAGSDALEYGGFLPQKYSSVMNLNLARVMRRHKDTLALHAPLRPYIDQLYDPEPLSKADMQLHKKQCQNGGPKLGEREVIRPGTLKLVDETMTRLMGGHSKPYGEFPFDNANDYYNHGGCANFLDGVRRPMLCLNAEDDPIVPSPVWTKVRAAIGYDAEGRPLSESQREEKGSQINDNIALAWTKGGGHLGWFEGVRPRRWLYKPVNEFIQAVFEQTSEERKRQIAQSHLWKHEGRVEVKEVDIELMPKEALPIYNLPGENGRPKRNDEDKTLKATKDETARTREGDGAASNGSTSQSRVAEVAADLKSDRPVAEDELLNPSDTGDMGGRETAPHSNARIAWLLTHVLPEAPLLHPRLASCDSYSPPPSDLSEAEKEARGWKILRGQKMYCDTRRPEVGWLELGQESRVSGAGEVFRGGIESPGARAAGEADKGDKKVVAGL
ncbi:uncharacterized protein PFL1_00254 [Pseudozyma flocculosa PF-1]|uniref:Related to putative acyltransferase n=1 Tax=Pseudozyma flocculosa TaxID=84751 RepID=A0A5C3ETM1_9BASI|nr:uncharacterized protein PFL1_00254 [Pseudozyma flocculosa PF-1]EPQ32056.1 hypothetical protein PFL1_00254 [Pseudozyma flocculosa PF-1]SPO35015.1 related to putative acyltransferase [Pseudozyma flocculosa]